MRGHKLDEEAPGLGDVLDFMRLIWALDHALQRTSKRMAGQLGVTGPQRLVLRIVGRFPGIPPGPLAELLHLHPSTLTGILQRLEHRGLIHRRSDPSDGRRLLLGLTAAGRRFDQAAEGTVEAAVQHVLSSTPRHKLKATQEVLTSLASRLLQPDGD